MFNNLTEKLNSAFKTLQGKHKISESNIQDALREVRRSLIEADVALDVIKEFIENIKNKAIGIKVGQGLNPYQEFIKLVQNELTAIIGGENIELNFKTQPPAVLMVAGLQGSGKTTSVAKLASFLKNQRKKVLVVSADVYRPAAIEQLQILAKQIDVEFFPSTIKDKPKNIVKKAKKYAQKQFFDVLIIDTAGRLHIDEDMMTEIKILHKTSNPIETLFVVDAMTGQDAAHTAKAFSDALDLTGVIITKVDGDARGGAALSVRYITGKPIKFLGIGEKTDALEPFHPDRIASRLLGMGDVLSLVEEIEKKVDTKKVQATAQNISKGRFDFNDMREQLLQMQNMGGMESIMSKLPGMGKLPPQAKNQLLNDKKSPQMVAIINSMTKKERIFPNLIKASRKKRIADGSGTTLQNVNQLLRQFEKMQKMMRRMKGSKMKRMMQQMQGMEQSGDMSSLLPKTKPMPKFPFRRR